MAAFEPEVLMMPVKKTIYQNVIWRGFYYLTAFLLNIAIARHFSAEGSGQLYYLVSIYSLAVLVISLSFESGITYFAANKEIAPSRLLSFSIAWSLVAGLLIFLFIYLFVPVNLQGADRSFLLLSVFCFITGNLLTTYTSGLFYAQKNVSWPNSISALINLGLISLLVSGKVDENYFQLYFIAFLLQGIFVTLFYIIKYKPDLVAGFLNRKEFVLLARYCVLAFLSNLIFFLLYRVDYWFVDYYGKENELGNYIQVSKLGQLFFILPTVLAGAVFPLTAGGQKRVVNKLLPSISRMILFVYLLACLVLAATGQWLFPTIFGKSFDGMYWPFLCLVPGILSLSGLFTLTAYYSGKNRIKVNIQGSLLALAVIIVGDSIFIPRYGIAAAALVSSIGYIVYQVYVLVIFKKEYGTPISDFFIPRASDWKELKTLLRAVNK